MLRAAALAATSVTESTARRHAETIAELEAKLAAQVAQATFGSWCDEEAALRGRVPGGQRRVAVADAAAKTERQRAAEADAAGRRTGGSAALRQTLEHRDTASAADRDRAADGRPPRMPRLLL